MGLYSSIHSCFPSRGQAAISVKSSWEVVWGVIGIVGVGENAGVGGCVDVGECVGEGMVDVGVKEIGGGVDGAAVNIGSASCHSPFIKSHDFPA